MANGNFGGGTGTKTSPYLVEDVNDLIAIGKKNCTSSGIYFKQIADIDLSEYTEPTQFPKIRLNNSYNQEAAIFEYDGGGYQILNLTQSQADGSSSSDFGLFQCYSSSYTLNTTRSNANNFKLKNINLVNVEVSGKGGSPILYPTRYDYSGSGYTNPFSIELDNCFVSGKMTLNGTDEGDASCFIPGKATRYTENTGILIYPTVKNCTAVMQVNIVSTTTGKTTFGGAIGDTEHLTTTSSYHIKMSEPLVANTAIHADIHVENRSSGLVNVAGLVNGNTCDMIKSYVNASFDFMNLGEGTINGYYFSKNAENNGTCIANHEKGGLELYSPDSLHFLTDEQMKTPSFYERLGWWI